MPKGNGTGPSGQGPETGRGIGRGYGVGRGRMEGNRPGAGPGGDCVCPECGTKVPHEAGVPCFNSSCSQCGAKMVRE